MKAFIMKQKANERTRVNVAAPSIAAVAPPSVAPSAEPSPSRSSPIPVALTQSKRFMERRRENLGARTVTFESFDPPGRDITPLHPLPSVPPPPTDYDPDDCLPSAPPESLVMAGDDITEVFDVPAAVVVPDVLSPVPPPAPVTQQEQRPPFKLRALVPFSGLYQALQILYLLYRLSGLVQGTVSNYGMLVDVVSFFVFRSSRRNMAIAIAILAICWSPYAPDALRPTNTFRRGVDEALEWVWSERADDALAREYPFMLHAMRRIAFDVEDLFLDDTAPACYHHQVHNVGNDVCLPRRAPCMRALHRVSGICVPYLPFTADACGASVPGAEHRHSVLAWYIAMTPSPLPKNGTSSSVPPPHPHPPPPSNTAYVVPMVVKAMGVLAAGSVLAVQYITGYTPLWRNPVQ